MSWFIHWPYYLHSELNELSSNGNYHEIATQVNRTLVSSGEIIVRLAKRHSFPVLIVYPDATPYDLPKVYLLQQPIDFDDVRKLSMLSPEQISEQIKGKVKYHYHRHQGVDGSLCILETEDLHNDRPELIGARAAIERVRQWCRGLVNGNFPMDNQEVELFCHFPNRVNDKMFLLTDEFFHHDLLKGKFYLASSKYMFIPDNIYRYYIGFGIEGITQGGVHLPSFVDQKKSTFLAESLPPLINLTTKDEKTIELLASGEIIEGWWWQIDREPQPFASVAEFVQYVGFKDGLEEVARELQNELRLSRESIYVAFRFLNRRGKLEWQFFHLKKPTGEGAFLGKIPIGEAEERLLARSIEAVRTGNLTDAYFHLRNTSRANRSVLKEQSVTLIGVGALGSAIAENLAKAGVGHLFLVDKGILEAHNVIRHTCGLPYVGRLKSTAVALNTVVLHNPFVKVKVGCENIMQTPIEKYFDPSSIGVSTIADDTVESYLNQESVRTGRTVFYARVLRGGKAARIFRVKPGIDACKECFVHYLQEENGKFIALPEDPELPALTSECNNPVRPASGADISIVAGLVSRIVIDYLQNPNDDYNHWIWYTENLSSVLSLGDHLLGSCRGQFIPPHPRCRLCQRIEPKEVLITQEAIDMMKSEAAESGKVETGGILIGFRSDTGNIVVVKATGPGPGAVRTENWFEKDVAYCQEQLNESSRTLGPKGQYVGEWHYHPRGTNQPSGTDIQSLSGIAEQLNYSTDEPLMIIFSPELEMAFTLHPVYRGFIKAGFKVINAEAVLDIPCRLV